MRRFVLLALVLLIGLPLAACGRKGAPHAPGPADRIIYPKSYPTE
ncbi:LPS translocon maturation chaperone LptM [Lichenicoccus roseus]|nr:hypothetical protein [Lichenicoccus roseus]